MSKKLYTVQAVLKDHFHNRPQTLPQLSSGLFTRDIPVLPIPPERRASLFQTCKRRALQEAERLARSNPAYVFLVMESVHMSYQDEFVSRPLEA